MEGFRDIDFSEELVPASGGVTTTPRRRKRARAISFAVGALATPFALGAGVAALSRSRRAGLIAGGLSALTAAALRWQYERWFNDEPTFELERRIGALEIRRYAPHLEAHTRLTVPDFETALDEGYRRLFKYIGGDNASGEAIQMMTPVLTKPRASTHTVAFVMPPGRTLLSLPRPKDDRIHFVHVPARRVAVHRFRGRYTDKVMLEQTRRLHELIAAADVDARGLPVFAAFDPPTTLPPLRRTELWIELV